ncbi:MAG: hypothetical protein IT365_29485 [Candidatus Hydrogenedentes bacterium]|nr:hypothetical protein [Candidatus Hydrogenedentota bacterium]
MNKLWYFWYPRTSEDVAQLLLVAACILPRPVLTRVVDVTKIDVDRALNILKIPRTMPVELLRLPGRARRFLEVEGLTQFGPLLDYLTKVTMEDLLSHEYIGLRTAIHLLNILQAIHEGVPDRIRDYLPLSQSGCGISFSASAALFLNAASAEDRNALHQHLCCHASLRRAAVPSGRSRSRIGQVVIQFVEAMERNLGHFSDERTRLQAEWNAGRPLQAALGDELSAAQKDIVAGALARLLSCGKVSFRQHVQSLSD